MNNIDREPFNKFIETSMIAAKEQYANILHNNEYRNYSIEMTRSLVNCMYIDYIKERKINE